mgnify:CR=1 FL=1
MIMELPFASCSACCSIRPFSSSLMVTENTFGVYTKMVDVSSANTMMPYSFLVTSPVADTEGPPVTVTLSPTEM